MAVTESIKPFENTQVDKEAAVGFLQWWFTSSDKTSLVSLSDTAMSESVTVDCDGLVAAIKKSMDTMCADFRNLYFVTATTKEIPKKQDGMHRPKADAFKSIKGVWIDLDVKEGSFKDAEAVEEFVKNLPQQPGAIVRTGSGGIHAYWKVKKPAEIDVDEIGLRWWSYIQSLAPEGVEIDRLTDVKTRLLRLPGSVRWPSRKKDGDSIEAHQVTVEYTDAPALSAGEIRVLTDETYETAYKHVRERKATEEAHMDDLVDKLTDLGPWGRRVALTMLDEILERNYSWSDILEPAGWTITKGTVGSGEVVWSRPGGSARSATTGMPNESSAMSLLSESPDTDLLDLKEAETPLTKLRVLARLRFNDDFEAALDWITQNV